MHSDAWTIHRGRCKISAIAPFKRAYRNSIEDAFATGILREKDARKVCEAVLKCVSQEVEEKRCSLNVIFKTVARSGAWMRWLTRTPQG